MNSSSVNMRTFSFLLHIFFAIFWCNFLLGAVPIFARNLDVSLSYADDGGLCGGILGPCDNKSSDRSFWYCFVIAYVCSATSVIVSFMYCDKPWTELKKRWGNTISSSKKNKQKNQTRPTKVAELLPLALQEEGSKELSRFLERVISKMDFGELCEATSFFSTDNVIGLGTTGIVYKAKLLNNSFMAVKRLYHSQQCRREFFLEAMIPGRHTHTNIVPLLGFCLVKKETILVYKYMSKGRLQDWLHSDQGPQPILLEWPVRLHIALGLARGLAWLHKCKIVHLNLSSGCVLLNKDFEPKISNFGKAKFIDQTIEDHLRTKSFMIDAFGVKRSMKEDVYSFGIILFELITGKRLSPTTDSPVSFDGSLLKLISTNLFTRPHDFYNAIDKSLIGKGFDDKILRLLEVACDCVKPSLEQRPEMVDTYKTISAFREGYGLTSDSRRLKLSKVCPVQITRNDEIECVN